MLAKKLNLQYIDTGAMYRCIALKMIQENVKLEEKEKIKKILDNIEIDLKRQKVFLNGKDVTEEIRTTEVANFSSPVSAIDFVRTKMVELQRNFSEGKNIVMEGRDIGTVVFPNADLKIYLDATSEERAKRRFLQNEKNGIKSNYEEILKDIIERDTKDKSRKNSPLKIADDAILIDTTKMHANQVVKDIMLIIGEI